MVGLREDTGVQRSFDRETGEEQTSEKGTYKLWRMTDYYRTERQSYARRAGGNEGGQG